ncbi:MAG: PIF1 family DEAD/DEAH box helicase, partial [Patescibacteria group bacterium]|nr:PIF1 family DEAD/DEAH box helicase [Patescibacteria group bacterium]
MTQEQALIILKTGANVFLTGEPGSGKTHTINQYVRYLRQHGIEPAITASTGIAATHIGGATIHSWSGIGIRDNLSGRDIADIASKEHVARRVSKTQVLIIDEVSMLGPKTLDAVEQVLRAVKKNQDPFGGIQIVLVGDFFQLPPVVKRADADSRQQAALLQEPTGVFAYESHAWRRAEPIVCYLHEQYRQDDAAFLDALACIRKNEFEEHHYTLLASRKIVLAAAPERVPRLFTHNVDVDRVNLRELRKIGGKQYSFTMAGIGSKKLVETLKKGCLSPERLQLAAGATVMFTKNNPQAGYVNGTLGTIEGFDEGRTYPIVRTTDGRRIQAEPADWTVEEGGKIRGRITQFPLRLAWAITVHKSQGMSMDAAVMDLSQVFEYGQGYVALSRVRTLSGIHLLGWNERTFRVHPDVLEQDALFRAGAANAEQEYDNITAKDHERLSRDFITRCGGTIATQEPKPSQEPGKKSAQKGETYQ